MAGKANLAKLQMLREKMTKDITNGYSNPVPTIIIDANGSSRSFKAPDSYDDWKRMEREAPMDADMARRMGHEPPMDTEMVRRMGHEPPMDTEMARRSYTRSAYDGNGAMNRRMGFGEQPMDTYDTEMRRRRRSDGTFMRYGGEPLMDDEPEMRRRRSDGTFMHYGMEGQHEREPIRFGGMVAMEGGKRSGNHKLTREMAEEWVENLEGSDPNTPRGAKWTMDQVKPLATKYGIPTEGEKFYEFWAVMNAMYSDYFTIAKKYNLVNADFFADLSMAFINDKDAVKGKTAMYYECIVDK